MNKDVLQAIMLAGEIPKNMQTTDNLVTEISSESTDEQYPSAKAVFDAFNVLEDVKESHGYWEIIELVTGDGTTTNSYTVPLNKNYKGIWITDQCPYASSRDGGNFSSGGSQLILSFPSLKMAAYHGQSVFNNNVYFKSPSITGANRVFDFVFKRIGFGKVPETADIMSAWEFTCHSPSIISGGMEVAAPSGLYYVLAKGKHISSSFSFSEKTTTTYFTGNIWVLGWVDD